MTDEQFDDLARGALAFDPGRPSEATWVRIKPVRWAWVPTFREIMVCGCAGALTLAFVGLGIGRKQAGVASPNPAVQRAMINETQSVLASVSRITGAEEGDPLATKKTSKPSLD